MMFPEYDHFNPPGSPQSHFFKLSQPFTERKKGRGNSKLEIIRTDEEKKRQNGDINGKKSQVMTLNALCGFFSLLLLFQRRNERKGFSGEKGERKCRMINSCRILKTHTHTLSHTYTHCHTHTHTKCLQGPTHIGSNDRRVCVCVCVVCECVKERERDSLIVKFFDR